MTAAIIEQIVVVAEMGQALVVEDRVELGCERRPQGRRGAGAADAVQQRGTAHPGHVLVVQGSVEGIA
jgi:hypothetical protein